MSTPASLPRPRWYAAAVIGAVLAIAAASVAAALVDDDLADTLFGIVTGMTGALLLAVVLWIEVGRSRLARMRDASVLDDLEPLRAATDADTAPRSADGR